MALRTRQNVEALFSSVRSDLFVAKANIDNPARASAPAGKIVLDSSYKGCLYLN